MNNLFELDLQTEKKEEANKYNPKKRFSSDRPKFKFLHVYAKQFLVLDWNLVTLYYNDSFYQSRQLLYIYNSAFPPSYICVLIKTKIKEYHSQLPSKRIL